MKNLILAMLAALLLSACSKPQDTVIPSDVSKWDTELAPQVKKLPDEEQKLAVAYIARAKLGEVFGGKGVPFGTTLGDAVKQQRAWQHEQEEADRKAAVLKAEVEKQAKEHAALVAQAVTVSLVSKRQLPTNFDAGRYGEEQEFKIAVKNTGTKPLVGVSGTIEFIDVFDKTVGAVGFKISEPLEPGAGTVWTGTRRYNQFLSEHRAVWDLEEGKYKTRFVPDTIVFADGTKLSAAPEYTGTRE
jgi:hypothetical protein